MTRTTDRLDELLAQRAIEGLDAEAERELEALLATTRSVDAGAFDRAAAAVHLAALAPRETLPASLRARLERAALAVMNERD